MAKPDGKGDGNKEKLLPVGAADVVKRAPQKATVLKREKFKASIEASLGAKSLQGTILAHGPLTSGVNVASDAPIFNYESLRGPEKLNATLQAIDYRNIGRLDVQKLEEYFKFLREMVLKGSIKIKDITDRIIPNTNYALVLAKDNAYCAKLPPAIKRYKAGTPFRKKYEELASAVPTAKKYYIEHEMVFGMYMKFFGQRIDQSATSYLFDRDVGSIPSKESLKGAHPDALDVFFKPVRVENGLQEGPPVYAMSSGVVIAVGRNYSGKTEDLYTGEGLTIQGGNGVITFNPQTREYQYYSHFFKTNVEPGDFVNAGDTLGIGGNSGYGADKPGRGSHVHWEVHKDGKAVPSAKLHSIISGEKIKASRRASLDGTSLQGTMLAQAFPLGGGNVASDAPSFDYESFVAAPKIRKITNVRKEFPYVEGIKSTLAGMPSSSKVMLTKSDFSEIDGIVRSNWSNFASLDYDQYFLVANRSKGYAAVLYYNKRSNTYRICDVGAKLKTGGVRLSEMLRGVVTLGGETSNIGIDVNFANILASKALFGGIYGRNVIVYGQPAAVSSVPKPVASAPVERFKTEDDDYKRNKDYIEARGISFRQETLTLKGKTFKFNVYEKSGNRKFKSYVVLHDTENDAFDVGIRAIGDKGGRLIALENKGQRNFLGTNVDPNRIFREDHEYYPVAEKILELLGSQGPIVSLHNNRNISRILGASYKNIKVFKSAEGKSNPDNVIWIAGQMPIDQMDFNTQEEIRNYQNSNINVVYEYVPPPKGNDNSLSNWAALNGRPYYNIEIETGEFSAQKQYLDAVLAYCGDVA